MMTILSKRLSIMIFVDTSALYAVLDVNAAYHARAKEIFPSLISRDELLVTSNYVLLETLVVVQRRIGLEAARTLHNELRPVLQVEWVTEAIHDAAEVRLLLSGRRNLSLVDCVSFELMRQRGISRAFTFDPHFAEQGFECLPG